MKLPAYLPFIYDEDELLLKISFPNYIGKLCIGEAELSPIASSQIAGYRLYITYKGELGGKRVHLSLSTRAALQQELDAMAAWYLVEVISKDLARYDRYML
jgi:hypothetical protein